MPEPEPEPEPVRLAIDGEDLVITGGGIGEHRKARLFFRSVLSAQRMPDGWRCQPRHHGLPVVVVRVNDWLEKEGFSVEREGLAESSVASELQRRESFARTRVAAAQVKAGEDVGPLSRVDETLLRFGWNDSRLLRPHQRAAVVHALAAGNAANFSVPGAGKTVIALATAACQMDAGNIESVVVVGPLSSFDPWERETRAALPRILEPLRVRGSRRERERAYSGLRRRQLLLLSYPTAASDEALLTELFRRHDVMLIVDESHRVKRFRGGLWAPALRRLAKRAKVRMVLSGTPMPQGGRDLFSQMNVLWPDGQLTGTAGAFAADVDNRFSQVLDRVGPFVSRTPKEALGLPAYEVERHDVAMGPLQEEVYDLVVNRFQQQLADAARWSQKLEVLRRGRPIRLLQAAANPELLNRADAQLGLPAAGTESRTLLERLARYGDLETPAKHVTGLRIVERIAGDGGKTVVWSNFIGSMDLFSELVRSQLGLACFQIDGRVPAGRDALRSDEEREPYADDTREAFIAEFLKLEGPAVLVANPASCSESISLHSSCHNALYLDRTYDCALFLQSVDRIHRLGLPDNARVVVHILHSTFLTEPSVDHLVDEALARKESRMRLLLEGAELAPLGLDPDPVVDAEGDEEDLAALLRFLMGLN